VSFGGCRRHARAQGVGAVAIGGLHQRRPLREWQRGCEDAKALAEFSGEGAQAVGFDAVTQFALGAFDLNAGIKLFAERADQEHAEDNERAQEQNIGNRIRK
jgi:hypothetical protein